MSSAETITVLNDLLQILAKSFPQYLRYSRPYIPAHKEQVVDVLEDIVRDQDALIDRIYKQVHQSGAPPDLGEFPMEFTDCHDLAIDYLVQEAIRCGQQDIENLAACADSLNLAPAAKSLAEEALGMTKGHVESLEELVAAKVPA